MALGVNVLTNAAGQTPPLSQRSEKKSASLILMLNSNAGCTVCLSANSNFLLNSDVNSKNNILPIIQRGLQMEVPVPSTAPSDFEVAVVTLKWLDGFWKQEMPDLKLPGLDDIKMV